MDHPHMLQMKILNGTVRRTTPPGSIRVLELEPVAFAGGDDQQVQLSAGVDRPFDMESPSSALMGTDKRRISTGLSRSK
jgi:hypothetical protein